MKQAVFETRYRERWQYIEQVLTDKKNKADEHFPQYYRELCHQLAIAKQRQYSPHLIEYLNELVTQGHHYFYRHNYKYHFQWLEFFVYGFPNAIRRNIRFVSVATALFVLPLVLMGLACYLNSEFLYSIMGVSDVSMVESMYQPGEDRIGRERSSDTDIMMFGYYIKNNIGISFRTFAGGILFGIGSIFFLVYNGLFIGGIGGHLTQLGYGSTFYPFVAGHGSFELSAIVFSGAAGLKLGFALLCPGGLRRKDALKVAGKDAMLIMYGVIIMLLIAAFIEAFWSSTTSLPAIVKYVVGLSFWGLLFAYLYFSGRRHGS